MPNFRFFLTYYAKSIAKSVKISEKLFKNVKQVLVRLDIEASSIVKYKESQEFLRGNYSHDHKKGY